LFEEYKLPENGRDKFICVILRIVPEKRGALKEGLSENLFELQRGGIENVTGGIEATDKENGDFRSSSAGHALTQQGRNEVSFLGTIPVVRSYHFLLQNPVFVDYVSLGNTCDAESPRSGAVGI
jgi:hypothetical protein